MSARWRLAVLSAVGIAVGVLVGAGAALLAAREQAEPAPYKGSRPPKGFALGDFDLTSYTGKRVSRSSVDGKVVALTFLETQCETACPIIASQVADGLDLLSAAERQQVAAVAVSTHPGDDRPASVRAFLRTHRALGKLDYLVGSVSELRPVWRRFMVVSVLESGDVNTHSASVRIFAADGRWVSTLHPGIDLTAENFAYDVRRALAES